MARVDGVLEMAATIAIFGMSYATLAAVVFTFV